MNHRNLALKEELSGSEPNELFSDLIPGSSRTFYEMAVNDTDDRIGRDGREGKYLTVLTGPEVTQMDRTEPL